MKTKKSLTVVIAALFLMVFISGCAGQDKRSMKDSYFPSEVEYGNSVRVSGEKYEFCENEIRAFSQGTKNFPECGGVIAIEICDTEEHTQALFESEMQSWEDTSGFELHKVSENKYASVVGLTNSVWFIEAEYVVYIGTVGCETGYDAELLEEIRDNLR